ncbi:MAG: hypothetical protein IIZ48_08065 [Erysipelotrichales bacterium]|nr:hypothetical protein [Erysipelotrichales bacterium]
MSNKGREKNKVGGSGSVGRKGSGLGTGKVGREVAGKVISEVLNPRKKKTSQNRDNEEPGSRGLGGMPRGTVTRTSGFGGLPVKLVLVLLVGVLLFTAIRSCGGNSGKTDPDPVTPGTDVSKDPYFGFFSNQSTASSGWTMTSNLKKLDTSVASGSRAKRTKLAGNGNDTVTIMVYMCGTDLESKSAMATYDLQEMLKADVSDKINLIVYTGGCRSWKNNIVSSNVNQIFQLKTNDIECLVQNAGNAAMTNPATLQSFIEYCDDNFPADRYELIFWDHGGGSITGYGYDEKYSNSGSMDLAEIDQALTAAGVSFDFVGFDACLMATAETAFMLAEHADYMIGSEESEPGIGWYYTNWLTALSKNTSMPTIEIGKQIADDFVATCQQQCRGQSATLSLIDLAEFENTVPSKLTAFAQGTNNLITNNGYRTVASARSGSREFAASSGIDMVDMIDMANRLGTTEGKELCKALLGCVKYNNTSADMSNSYGLSIYFPYRSMNYVNSAIRTYQAIDLPTDYISCIRNFATTESTGQIASGGSSNPYSSLLGTFTQDYSTVSSGDLIYSLLGEFLSGALNTNTQPSYSNYYTDIFSFLFGGRSVDNRSLANYIAENHFDADLTWKNGKINLTKEQWEMVDDLQLNVFYDDGEGYIDLGTDNLIEIDENGNLIGDPVTDWMSINGMIIPYYYVAFNGQENGDYVNIGRVPVLMDGTPANLILAQIKEGDSLGWVVAGASFEYNEDPESAIQAKNLTELENGTKLEFVCDYYQYDGTYEDSYVINEMTVDGTWTIGNMDLDDPENLVATYQFTDIYQKDYWTNPIGK